MPPCPFCSHCKRSLFRVTEVTGGRPGNEALGCPAWFVPEAVPCSRVSRSEGGGDGVGSGCPAVFCSTACAASKAHEKFCGSREYAELVERGRAKEEHAHVAVAHLWAEGCNIEELVTDVPLDQGLREGSREGSRQPGPPATTPAGSEEWGLVSRLFPERSIEEYNIALGRIALNSTCLRPTGPFEMSMRAIAQVKNPLIRLQAGQRLEKLIETSLARKIDARAPVIGGIYRIQSSVNHSCEPNCASPVAGPSGDCKLLLVAKRDIQKGEEITFSYVDESLPTHERKKMLLVHYHFDCNCPRCGDPASHGGARLPIID